MATFDGYVAKLAQYVEQMQGKGVHVRRIDCPATASELLEGLPIRVGEGAQSGIILRGDTFIELGSPDVGSCSFFLWTNKPALISDRKITLVGPDIPESPGASLPLGQVLMLGGQNLCEEDQSALERALIISDQIEGYMVKSVSQHTWGRVSNEAAQKGFCFETLGRGLMAIVKSALPKVEAMEILFVTSSKEDLQPLENMATQVQEIAQNIVRENWKAKGYNIDECGFGGNCSDCGYRPVCDEVREVIADRKRDAD